MKFNQKQAELLGLTVGGKNGTALVSPIHGFAGRRIYIDRGTKTVAGPLIHLSGFTVEECELLEAIPNPEHEFSGRVTGFLPVTVENLSAAAKMLVEAWAPPYEPPSVITNRVDVAGIFLALANK